MYSLALFIHEQKRLTSQPAIAALLKQSIEALVTFFHVVRLSVGRLVIQ